MTRDTEREASTSSESPDGFDDRWVAWMARGRAQNATSGRQMKWVGAFVAGAFACWQIVGAFGG